MKNNKLLTTIVTAMLTFSSTSQACTSLAITDNVKNIYHGRTMELDEKLPSWITYYPKGTFFQKKAPNGDNGSSYTTKYDILSITTNIYFDGDDHNILEGFNSAGLSFSLNMINNAELAELSSSEYSQSIPVTALGEWALSNFSTVEEVKEAILSGHFWSPVLKNLGGVKSPFHFAFYDKQGGSIVAEVHNGKFEVYDNPTKVMTNGPEFSWHLTNLNNYSQLTNQDKSTAVLGNMKVSQPDSGIAITDLPSSDTSVGRFIRGVYYTTYVPESHSPAEAINNLSHIMNRFDRMKNITVDSNGGEIASQGKPTTEYTVWTSLSDLTNGAIFVRGYNQIDYSKFTLSEFKKSDKPMHLKIENNIN